MCTKQHTRCLWHTCICHETAYRMEAVNLSSSLSPAVRMQKIDSMASLFFSPAGEEFCPGSKQNPAMMLDLDPSPHRLHLWTTAIWVSMQRAPCQNAVQEGLKVLRGILYIFREGTHIRAIVQAGDWLKNTSRPLPLLFKRLHVPLQ